MTKLIKTTKHFIYYLLCKLLYCVKNNLDSRRLMTMNRRKPMISISYYARIVTGTHDEQKAKHVEMPTSRHVFPGIHEISFPENKLMSRKAL